MGRKQLQKTIGFVVLLGGVLATFGYLGSQPGPPTMPPGLMHELRFDLNKQLIGVQTDPVVDLLALPKNDQPYDKRPVEKRINEGCLSCHATRPAHHPPKTECIKCHRMAPAPAPSREVKGNH